MGMPHMSTFEACNQGRSEQPTRKKVRKIACFLYCGVVEFAFRSLFWVFQQAGWPLRLFLALDEKPKCNVWKADLDLAFQALQASVGHPRM